MISVGIDVSKGKSTVCVMKPYGEIVFKPFQINHSESDLLSVIKMLALLEDDIRIVMESTGIYHLPLLTFFVDHGYFVSVVNPYAMKKYSKDNSIRGAKTDRLDSILIANYGIDKWHKLEKFKEDDAVYTELKLLGRKYRHYMEMHVSALLELTHMLDYTMPGIKNRLYTWSEYNDKDK